MVVFASKTFVLEPCLFQPPSICPLHRHALLPSLIRESHRYRSSIKQYLIPTSTHISAPPPAPLNSFDMSFGPAILPSPMWDFHRHRSSIKQSLIPKSPHTFQRLLELSTICPSGLPAPSPPPIRKQPVNPLVVDPSRAGNLSISI